MKTYFNGVIEDRVIYWAIEGLKNFKLTLASLFPADEVEHNVRQLLINDVDKTLFSLERYVESNNSIE